MMVMTITAKLCADFAFFGVYLWTSELFPTVVRSFGMSVSILSEKVGMISVPFVTTLLQTISYQLPFIVMAVIGVVAGVVGLWLPETKGKPTREQMEDFYEEQVARVEGKSSRRIVGIDNIANETNETDV